MDSRSSLERLQESLADRYRVERELGQGGMATVYLAHDLRHDRDVAIKVLHPELGAALGSDRFLSEIKTTAKLQHPHILPLLDSGEAGGLLYYVMPLVSGETLRARLTFERQLPIDDALRIAREVADALAYAHTLGIIHRDIKPENVLLQGEHALVADFGIALAVQKAGGARMTQTGLSLGTPQYMSPEQAMGERNIDARSDIYALGAVTYEMLTGEAPFTGPTIQAIVARVMSEEPRGLSVQRKAIPLGVEEAVLRALEKLPADRFSTAREFAAALDTRTTQTTRASRSPPATRAARLGLIAASAVALSAIALALWGWLRPVTQPPAVVRYRIGLESVPSLRDWIGEMAISPDGSLLVHIGGENGALLLRRRNELEFKTMPSTDGARAPFFSPDGTHIGFYSNGKLLVAALAGGPPIVLAESLVNPESSSWGDDGKIYRAFIDSQQVSSIGRMEPKPGAPLEQVTLVDAAAGETFHMHPDVLPNGKGVLFRIDYRDGRSAIAVGDLATRRHSVLFPGARARYAHSGHLLYTTMDGRLWSVPFNLGSLATAGTPSLVSEGIPSTMVGPVDFVVSASGTLAYAVEDASAVRELVWVSRDGRREPLDAAWNATFVNPALSPDGTRLAVAIRDAASSHIWIKRLAGGAATKLTLDNNSNDEPAWTPDGRSVSYVVGTSVAGSGLVGEVWSQSADGGSRATRVLAIDRAISEQAWSPLGDWLAVRTTTPTAGAGDILAMKTGTDRAEPIVATRSSEYTPAISPDGRWMAYASNESGRQEVYVVPFPVPGSAKWQVSTRGGMSPRWSRRGGELFYLDLQSNVMAAQVSTTPTFSLLGTQRLFSAADFVVTSVSRRNFDVSADDRRFLMVRPALNESAQLVVVESWFEELKSKGKE